MHMITAAWNAVAPSTIINCWKHTGIQPDTTPSTRILNVPGASTATATTEALRELTALKVIYKFATSEMCLLEAEESLQTVLNSCYITNKWAPILKIVMDAEDNTTKALTGLDQVMNDIFGLNKAVEDLKQCKQIIGMALTLEEVLNPIEEQEIVESMYQFEGGEDEIIEQVNHKVAVKEGEIVELESDDKAGGEADTGAEMGLGDMIHLCEQMEKFRIDLQWQEQATLWQWFGGNGLSH
ncbi:hypothetical protein EDC04DRAFT_2888348 [Pisolithus marmoratus]|nr:hypothetical protein EDC04DRAFT_2888348 [Pisolithus marmoratus]